MAKRYGIFPIIGDGQSIETAYRSAAADVSGVNTSSIIKSDVNGDPVWGFALSIVGAVGLSAVSMVTNSLIFPDYPLDGEIGSMGAGVLTALKQSLEAYDLDGQGTNFDIVTTDGTRSYRDLIVEDVYRFLDPLLTAGNFNNFDVAEPNE